MCEYDRRRHGDGREFLSENRRLRARRRLPSDVVVCGDDFAAWPTNRRRTSDES
jgi:hypothetical protein